MRLIFIWLLTCLITVNSLVIQAFSQKGVSEGKNTRDKKLQDKTPVDINLTMSEIVFNSQPLEELPAELQLLAANLQKNTILRSKFLQTKKITVLQRPLISKGKMLYSQSHGLYWSIESPFKSQLRLSANKVEQRNESGHWQTVAEGAPEISKITSIFLALLSGNMQQLSLHFTLYFLQQDGFWVIGLEPKDQLLKKIMARILLKGRLKVEEIITWDTNGDRSHIQFLDPVMEPVVLTETEISYFQEK